MTTTPELEKMQAARQELHTEAIGLFLDWLHEQGFVIASWVSGPYTDRLMTHTESTERLLARYAGVDLDAVEKERRQLLEAFLDKQKGGTP